MKSGALKVEQEYFFDASPAKVFRALTVPEELVRWFLKDAEIVAKAGTDYTFTWEGGFSHAGRVTSVSKNKSITMTWPDDIDGKRFVTKARFDLKPKGRGTILTVVHTGFKEGADWLWLFGKVNSGWAYYFTNLKSVLHGGADLRSALDNP